jgi:hypothetical protein
MGRPAQPGKRRVLRKIEPTSGASTMRPPPRASVPAADELVVPLQRPARTAVATAPPAPTVAYESVAPVTATVITPPFNTTLAPPPSPSRGSLRSVVVGAVLGLAIVGVFVVGTRLALQFSRQPSAAAQVPSQPAPIVPAQTSQPQQVPATAATGLADSAGVPVLAASELPVARPPRGRGHRSWKGAKGAPTVVASAASAEPPAPAPAPAPSASAAQASEPDPDDSAPSLVPVIPAASAPPVDPFVKAVQSDIDEENSKHR